MLKSLVLNLLKIAAQTDKIRKIKAKVITLLLMKATSVKTKLQEYRDLSVINSDAFECI